jgi:hypothetical protein
MNRREILKYTAMLTGTAICAPLTGIMLSGCSKQLKEMPTIPSSLAFFSSEDFTLITQIMDVILPKTDSPSASEVKVNYILDNMFDQVYKPDYQQKFTGMFRQLKSFLDTNKFDSMDRKKQETLLLSLEALTESQRNDAYWAYIDLKQQTVAFYLSTEEIAENHLNYLPIPGEYKPCVSLEDLGGKAWAI